LSARILVYGYGNPGRLDDGLGPAFADGIAARGLGNVRCETAYQLQIEDAALVAGHDVVVFADADLAGAGPFELRVIGPRHTVEFSTHSVAPEAILGLAREHFGVEPVGFLLGIRGYEFGDYGEGLSPAARANLAAAVDAMERWLREGSFTEQAVSAGSEG